MVSKPGMERRLERVAISMVMEYGVMAFGIFEQKLWLFSLGSILLIGMILFILFGGNDEPIARD